MFVVCISCATSNNKSVAVFPGTPVIMSTKAKNHRMSDGGVQNVVGKASDSTANKRRQTIADITTKENTTNVTSATKSAAIAPTQQRSSMSSPFKHHHTPVVLGAAASYYFKGVAQTPVQKMIRSEQQKLLLQASMQVEDEENTGSILANQSYLSSSSSSGGRNSSRDEMEGLNASVLSDTTELTASNFLVLAATHRTTAEEFKKIAEERRQPLSTLTTATGSSFATSKDELVAMSGHGVNKNKRRQSVSVGVVSDDKPSEAKTVVPRRRETMATVPLPRAEASPIELPAMISKTQRERNKVAGYQPRLSEASFIAHATSRRRSSIASNQDPDGTTELSISSSDMQQVLNLSIFGNEQKEDSSAVAVATSDQIDAVDDAVSPVRNSRRSVGSVSSSTDTSQKRSASKTNPGIDASAMSPARNTRSAAKKAAAEHTGTASENESIASLQSPSRRRTPTKSPQSKPSDRALEESRFHLSPAKSTRSATKKIPIESVIDNMPSKSDLIVTDDTTEKISVLLNALEPTGTPNTELVNGNTTASLGDLLDGMIPTDESRLDTSVTPTARNTRSALKERTSISTVYDTVVSSPARNTRSAQRKKVAASPSRDDTAQMLLDLAAGSFQQSHEVDMSSSSQTSKAASNASNTSEEAILNDLVEQYSTKKSVNSTPTKNVDVSQESTISLNDLLSEYLPQSQTQLSQEVVYIEDKSSASSRILQSAVSKASTIDTPPGMTNHDPFSGLDVHSAPHSPPSTIRFSAVEDSFVNTTAYVGRSPLRKSLTPSRLAPSPRRFIHSASKKKSPYRTALTPSRLPASPYRLSNTKGATEDNYSAYRKSLTPTKLQASPVRPKRSIDCSYTDEIEPSTAVKRQKTFDELQGLVKESIATKEPVPSSTSSNVNLLSALRRPGHGSVRSGVKRVAFRSPTFAEFNKLSPAENVTPMIVRRPSFSDKMYDDTAEIEVDMQTLMQSNPNNIQGAGRTPGAKSKLMRMDSINDSNMSVDSNTIPIVLEEPTMTLESDMLSMLHNTSEVEKANDQEMMCADEDTIELETDINALLSIPTNTNEESIHVGRRSLIFDDEPTFELESDMKLLMSDDTVSGKQPPIESRRFSIAPSRRLSISFDGSFDHTKVEDIAVITVPRNDECIQNEDINTAFDLKVDEIVDFPLITSFVVPDATDFLVDVEHAMRENGISDTMLVFTAQVLQMIESQTDPCIEPNSTLELDSANASLYLALQSFFRSENKEALSDVMTLASSLFDFDIYEWRMWLVSATEQLGRPLDDKSMELADEIKQLDRLCIDTEHKLASVSNKSVQKARKKDAKKRMSEIVSLEDEIASMEAEIHRFQGYLKATSSEATMFSTIVDAIEENTTLSSSLLEGDKLASKYEQQCNTLKGAVKFKPLALDHVGFSFSYLGSSAKTCFVLSFDISSTTSVSVNAKVDPTLFESRGSLDLKRLRSVSSFLQIRMEYLCAYMRQQLLRSTTEIPSSLRRFEHLVGRLESTAAEIAKLNQRYPGKISFSHVANLPLFHLKIGFPSHSRSALLCASFELCEAYPFSPLNVCVDTYDSNVDVAAIQKLMVKNAKPGYGYLSRLCDIVESAIALKMK